MSNDNAADLANGNPRFKAFWAGASITLFCVTCYALFGITASVIFTISPYVAGLGMFVALLAIFASIIGVMKKVRKSAHKEAIIWDCYVGIAIIGVAGYFLAACVQTFVPGANPAILWQYGAGAAASFATLFFVGKFINDVFKSGKNAK